METEPAAAPATALAPAAEEPAPVAVPEGVSIFAAPAVRKFAREIGVDLAEVSGSGPGGRISEEDVKQHAHWLDPSRPAIRRSAG